MGHKYVRCHYPACLPNPQSLTHRSRCLSGLSSLKRIVAHPAYWGRGHGTELARWGVSLAALDGVDQGVIGSSMGARLFERVGFHRNTDIHIDGDERDREGFDLAVLRFKTATAAESSSGRLDGVVP